MILVVVALICICALVVLFDLRLMRLPNALSLAVIALFAVQIMLVGFGPWVWQQVAFASVMFVLCFGAFALNFMGGGDAKVLPSLSLFIPIAALPQVLVGFGVVLLISIAVITFARRHLFDRNSAWAVLRSHKLPLGVPIGFTGFGALLMGL